MDRIIHFSINNKLILAIGVLLIVVWGTIVAPFDWEISGIQRNPVPVDAIPDISENQQIVFTSWPGHSPKDIEDQVTYPLTVSLLGLPGVKTVRSFSYFGYSSIYVIFKEDVEFYWSRSRILEKLASLPAGTFPAGVSPSLGPDATALGQVFWYTIEGQDAEGNTTGGWDLDELRSVQDWYVRYALQSVDGVADIASIGGFVREYQIDINPDALRAYDISLTQVINAVRNSNVDVGARTIEVNKVEYVVRGLGLIRSLDDVRKIAVSVKKNNVPVLLEELAHVSFGPALRRGALDKDGQEAVGGVAIVRYGENPLATIQNLKAKIREITPGLPSKTLDDGRVSSLRIVPFYDRSSLISETLQTLYSALTEQVLVTIIVVTLMVMHAMSSVLISALLPLSILIAFILMRIFGIDANIVALSGIAIAIGTMVDLGIVLCENILARLREASPQDDRAAIIFEATKEVSGAVVTAVGTTIVSFLPVFALQAAEGKLFQPLAYTKTFSLIGALIVSLILIPPAAHLLFRDWGKNKLLLRSLYVVEVLLGLGLFFSYPLQGLLLCSIGLISLGEGPLCERFPAYEKYIRKASLVIALLLVLLALSGSWQPLGIGSSLLSNSLSVALLIAFFLLVFVYFQRVYPKMLAWCLLHRSVFLVLPISVVLGGTLIWSTMGEEFMPPLDEGSFLYMPTTMPHASIGEALDIVKVLDKAVTAIPEVEQTVGKLGRVDSALDPAPVSMFENIINYKSEYILNEQGHAIRFRWNSEKEEFERNGAGNLIQDDRGRPFRQWREHIQSPDDIWKEIVKATRIPGTTSAPKLQPIAARIVMLQSGMRAPMGVKIRGPSLEAISEAALKIEEYLRQVPSIEADAVVADRVVGKPFLEIDIDREKIARYGLTIRDVQDIVGVAIGGKPLTSTVEGRERYPVRIRYPRELRSDLESLGSILIPTPQGQHIPLRELSEIRFKKQAQVIKSEDTFLTSYVVFDKKEHTAEVEVVREARDFLETKIASGDLKLPAGVNYVFAGSYENQLRAQKRLALLIPLTLIAIFVILYLQFRSSAVACIIFSGVFVAWSGGFILLWLYSQHWFLDISLLGLDLRDFFQVRQFNLSVAVWVGFIALFGIATDDGVLMATYIRQQVEKSKPGSREELRSSVLQASERRIRPALMTTATTLLALIPVITSSGRGADIMVPMAIPSFGGMLIAMLTVFVVPVLYYSLLEKSLDT